jgi:hypothetical protein
MHKGLASPSPAVFLPRELRFRFGTAQFVAQEVGYRAVVETGYFDEIAQVVSAGNSSTTALAGSTEAEQFHNPVPRKSSTRWVVKHLLDKPSLRRR